ANLSRGGHDRDRSDVICADLVEYLKSVDTGAFDTFLCFGVLCHLIEHVDIVREVGRIAPGGFILDRWVARERWKLGERLRTGRV
ncbi:methyltransferase domain-containing protein, partial [Burkholderia pseudomallei]